MFKDITEDFQWASLKQGLLNRFTFRSTKTFAHNLGLSAAFRQYLADSHCHYVHGYALQVKLMFQANMLDARNWVVDFGSLKSLKQILEDTFDHKTLVAYDDPEMEWFQEGHKRGIIDLVVVPATGCEMFAAMIASVTEQWLIDAGYGKRIKLDFVEVSEHPANSAIVEPI